MINLTSFGKENIDISLKVQMICLDPSNVKHFKKK